MHLAATNGKVRSEGSMMGASSLVVGLVCVGLSVLARGAAATAAPIIT